MATADERLLKILLQVQSDVSGIAQVKTGLADTQAQVEAITASQTDQLGIMASATAAEEERSAALAQQAAIESQLQVIAQTRFDLTAARVAGDAASASVLTNELAVRTASLGVMRSEVLSAAQLNALTESEAVLLSTASKSTAAVAAGGLLAGVNLNKAKGEAMTLARELETGSVNSRTLGALLGSFGPQLTVAAIAGFGLWSIIKSASADVAGMASEEKKATDELDDQVSKWTELVKAAGGLSDVVNFEEKLTSALDKASAQFDQIQKKTLTFKQQLIDAFASIPGGLGIPGMSPYGVEQPALDAQKKAAQELLQIRLEENVALDEAANKEAADWEQLKSGPAAEAITALQQKIAGLNEQLAILDTKRTPTLGATPQELQSAKDAQDAYTRIAAEKLVLEKRLDDETKGYEKLTGEVDKTAAAIASADFKNLDPSDKLQSLDAQLAEIQKKLQLLGVSAASPAQALAQVGGLPKDSAEAVIKLVAAWTQVTNEVRKANEEQTKSAEVDQRREINDLLKQESTELEGIRQQQDLIKSNPNLSVQEQQELLHNSALREQAVILTEIQKTQAEIAKLQSIGDPKNTAEIDRLIAEEQKLETQSKKLGYTIKETTFSGEITSDLQKWVNSWGTAAHQIASTIQSTIGTALNQLNQYIVTGKFNVQDLEKSFVLLGLQLIEQLAIQEAAALIAHASAVALAKIAGPQIAASYAGAAAAVAIATYGAAADVGAAAVLGSYATIAGALAGGSGGYRAGGYTGDGSPDDIAGPVHGREFVFTEEETRALGVPFLQRLAANAGGIARFAGSGGDMSVRDAGRLATGGDDPNIFMPPTLTHGDGSPYTPAWAQSQPYWGNGPDNSRPEIPDENIAWNAPGMPPIGAPSVDVPTYQDPSVTISGGNPTVETPTGPGDTPFENIGWNPPEMPTDASIPDENIGWNPPPDPSVQPWGGYGPDEPGSSDYTTYGIVPGLGSANPTGLEDLIAASHGRSRTGGTGGSRYGIRARHTGGLVDDELSLLQKDEFVVNAPAVQHTGVDALNAINDMRVPSHHAAIGSGAPSSIHGNNDKIEIHVWADQDEAHRKFLSSTATRKHLQQLVRRTR